jgi:AAA+ ATPase superfamily predicted ATPase
MTTINPFQFGALALDEAFADREDAIAEIKSDMQNGQDVVVYAPRRYGKTSLVWAATRTLVSEGALVAQVDLMTTPTKERLASALAAAIFEEIASPLERVREKALTPFKGLRVSPTINISPETGAMSFGFSAGRKPADIDATLERLLELPAELGSARGRTTALVIDEFQEVVDIDTGLPKLMRAIFQRQPEVSHVYLGSKRHVMERIFSDANEPFWRSAKSIELGPIEPDRFATFIRDRFQETDRDVDDETLGRLLDCTWGHPYATQELSYCLWDQILVGETASVERLESALNAVLRSENAHFSLLWESSSNVQKLVLQALSGGPGRPYTEEYRDEYDLPPLSAVQSALKALTQREVVLGKAGEYRIVEPFLAEWLRRRSG